MITEEEVAESLMNEILIAFSDMEDDTMIPLREFMRDVGAAFYDIDDELLQIPAWTSAGWLRANIRQSIAGLSRLAYVKEVLERDLGC